jgi:hypothetical protein
MLLTAQSLRFCKKPPTCLPSRSLCFLLDGHLRKSPSAFLDAFVGMILSPYRLYEVCGHFTLQPLFAHAYVITAFPNF